MLIEAKARLQALTSEDNPDVVSDEEQLDQLLLPSDAGTTDDVYPTGMGLGFEAGASTRLLSTSPILSDAALWEMQSL